MSFIEFKIGILKGLFRWFFKKEDQTFIFRYLEFKIGLLSAEEYEAWMEAQAMKDFPKGRREELGLE